MERLARNDLHAEIKQRPTKLRRRAEHLRHQRKEWTGTPFYSNLYSFVIGFCDQEKSGSLKEPTKDPEEHLRKTYSDERKHKPVTIPIDMHQFTPEDQMDISPPTGAKTVKQARSASTPDPQAL